MWGALYFQQEGVTFLICGAIKTNINNNNDDDNNNLYVLEVYFLTLTNNSKEDISRLVLGY